MFIKRLEFVSAPGHAQMGREFQSVQSDAVDHDGQNVQDHIQTVTKYQQDNGQDHQSEFAQEGASQFIDGCGDRGACQTDCPKTNVGNNVREQVEDMWILVTLAWNSKEY